MNQLQVSKSHYLVLATIILIGVMVRAAYLNQPMRYDESLTFLRYASQPLETVVASYSEPNNHIFHSVLVHGVYRLLGNSPAVLRLPAFIAGILLIPALYALTRMFYTPHAGLIAAALCAVSLPLVEFSANARGYTLLALIVVLLMTVAKRQRDKPTLLGWLAFIVLTALGFWTIPVMLYPLGVIGFWMILSYKREYGGWQFIKRVLLLGVATGAAAALTLLLYSPVIAQEGLSALTQNEFVARPEAFEFYQRLLEILLVLIEFPNLGFPILLVLILLVGFVLALVLHRRLSTTRFSPGWAMLLWLALALFIMRVIPFDRTWTTIMPFYFMLVAGGLAFIFGRSERLFSLLLVVLIAAPIVGLAQSGAILASARTGRSPDAEAAALWLGKNLVPGDVVLIATPLDETVRYYLDLHGFPTDAVHNQYETFWIDLLQAEVGHVYVFGIPEADAAVTLSQLNLPAPTFNASLELAHELPETTIQQLNMPHFEEGILYADSFQGSALFSGWTVNNTEVSLVKLSGSEYVLSVAAGENSGEMILDGAADWDDYAVEFRVRVVTPSPTSDDVYLYIRNTPRVGSYVAGYDIEEARAYIAGDANEQWRGLLAEAPMDFVVNRWYTLRFSATGSEITLDIDGEEVASVQDAVVERGSIRFLFPAQSEIQIDDMVVSRTGG